MDLSTFKTLAGISLSGLPARLDAELPKDAYKGVPGVADLTDIDPNYMRKTFNEVFGMCGVGWGYKYAPSDLHCEIDNRPRSNGSGNRRVYMATLMRLTFWYKLVGGTKGEVILCEIDASGGSENDVEAYAMKGAITNALGNAASNIGFQESVYLGKRSHKTVGNKSSAPKPVAKTAPKTTSAKTEVPAPKAEASAGTDTSPSFLVSIGKRAGKTLSEIYAEGEEGAKAIQFYTTMATGGNAGKEALRNAAITFLAKHNGHIASVAA